MLMPTNIPWRAAGLALVAGALFAVGWVVNGWRKDAELAELTAARAQGRGAPRRRRPRVTCRRYPED